MVNGNGEPERQRHSGPSLVCRWSSGSWVTVRGSWCTVHGARNAPRSGAARGVSQGCRRWPTLPRPLGRSTIGAVGLNDRVRDGNGCGPYALVASVQGKHSVVCHVEHSRNLVPGVSGEPEAPERPIERIGRDHQRDADSGGMVDRGSTNPETMCCSACS